MKTYTITPVCAGVFQGAEKSNFAYQKDPGVKLKAPILMYLVQGNGLCMLVDTGCSDGEWAARYHHPLVQREEMKPVNALRKLGVESEDVQIIVNTHLHWDHCFHNDKFPNAKIYVQKREIQFAVCPIPTQYVYYESPQIHLTPSWVRAMDRMEIIDGDLQLCEGIDVLLCPGHTPGFQCVLVNTTDGPFLITSDSTGVKEAWQDRQTAGLPTPSGIHVNLEEYYETIRRIYPLADQEHILPGHDPVVLEHSVYPYK